MTNEFLIYVALVFGIIAPFTAPIGLFLVFFDICFSSRNFEPRPVANKLQFIGFLLLFVPSCLSLALSHLYAALRL
jgi:hypothetical protein